MTKPWVAREAAASEESDELALEAAKVIATHHTAPLARLATGRVLMTPRYGIPKVPPRK